MENPSVNSGPALNQETIENVIKNEYKEPITMLNEHLSYQAEKTNEILSSISPLALRIELLPQTEAGMINKTEIQKMIQETYNEVSAAQEKIDEIYETLNKIRNGLNSLGSSSARENNLN